MPILRRPGQDIVLTLPTERGLPEEERTRLHVKVPDKARWDQLREKIQSGDDAVFENYRWAIGFLVERWEGLYREDGSEIPLEKDEKGFLSEDVADEIAYVLDDIAGVILGCGRITARERKNSR